ncbi:MAG: alpha/beta hydrolase [Erythrobacter sp.]
MKLLSKIAIGGLASALIATPILAQRGDRPSRGCIREGVQLCGRDRAKIRGCLQTKFRQLSQSCQDEMWSRMEKRLTDRRAQTGAMLRATALMQPSTSIAFGEDERQQVDFYAPAPSVKRPPLILFVHGGGWSIGTRKAVESKPVHFTKNGYAFASTGYRLMPDAPVEEQASDVGEALQLLQAQAGELGFDPNRIVVMGHSAGAHLTALISTDPQYAGDAFSAIQGAVLLDGSGYDIVAQLDGSSLVELPGLYKRVFGEDPKRQAALSPISHIGGRDASDWLILHVDDRPVSTQRSQDFGKALIGAGLSARVLPISDTDHGRMNRELGTEPGAAQTRAVDAFLAQVLG